MLPAAVVRNLVVCDDIVTRSEDPHKVDLLGVLANLDVVKDRILPAMHSEAKYRYPELCVYAALSEVRGAGTLQIRCVQSPEETVAFTTPVYRVRFPNDPLQVIGIPFRIRNCVFPQLGLYAIQLWYNGTRVDERFLRLR